MTESNESKGYLICPCTGDRPFIVQSLASALDYLSTEEYHCVNLDTMQGLTEDEETYSLVHEL